MKNWILIFSIAIAGYSFSQTANGFIYYARVAESTPEYTELVREYEQMIDVCSWNASLEELLNECKMKTSTSQEPLDSAGLVDFEQELLVITEKMERFEKELNEDLEKQETIFLEKLEKIVSQYIAAFCELNNINSLSRKEGVLHCDDCIDYTEELINYISVH